MPARKKRVKRRVLKVNQTNLLRHLKVVAGHGIVEQGSETAIQIGRNVFYYQKGQEKFPLSDQEVGKLIFQ
jgi:DNA-binding transcriptional ArsR family regulator